MDEHAKARLAAYQRALTTGVVEHFDVLPEAAADVAAAVCRHLEVDKSGVPKVVDRFGDPVGGMTVADIVGRHRQAQPEAFRKAEQAVVAPLAPRHTAAEAARAQEQQRQASMLESMMAAGNPYSAGNRTAVALVEKLDPARAAHLRAEAGA